MNEQRKYIIVAGIMAQGKAHYIERDLNYLLIRSA